MKKITLVLVIIFPFAFFGQDDEKIVNTKLDFGFSFSPDYSYRFLTSDDENKWLKENNDTLEIGRVGFTIGTNMLYKLNDNISVASGLWFSDRGERTKKHSVAQLNNYINHYYYIDVPLKMNYSFFENEYVKFFATAGLSVNVFVNHTVISLVDGVESDYRLVDNKNISRVNLGALAGAGMDCRLTDKWYFKAEALYRQSISPIGSTPVKKYLFSVSPTLGFFLHF